MSNQLWPKRCTGCERQITEAEWKQLQFVGYFGAIRSGGQWLAVELRNCECHSTIGIEVTLPIAKPVHDEANHEQIDCCLKPNHEGPCLPWPF